MIDVEGPLRVGFGRPGRAVVGPSSRSPGRFEGLSTVSSIQAMDAIRREG